MAIEEITYEEFLKTLEKLEQRYLSNEEGFPEGAKEKGLEICKKFRKEVEETGPENYIFYIDTIYGLPLYKPKELVESEE